MILNKVLIDTNVCLDAAQIRRPFAVNALKIIELSQFGDLTGIVAAHSLDTMFYILNANNSKKEVYTILRGFRLAFDIAAVNQSIIDAALNLNWNDFEDAIHYESARAAGCEAIITRNKKDFEQADLEVLTPTEFLDQLNQQ